VREDPSKDDEFKTLDQWNHQKHADRIYVPVENKNGRTKKRFSFNSNSLSGNERNRLFLRHGENFADATLVSGADTLADGRSFALVDFDQDGWLDIALMSLNAPRFTLYRNEMKQFYPNNKSIRIKLVGGQSDSDESNELSNRDAIGAKALIEFQSGKKVMLQRQCGEGFASQNSEVLSLGVPAGDEVVRIKVSWPSGIEQNVAMADLTPDDSTEAITIKEELK
jgi:hypothetical protein